MKNRDLISSLFWIGIGIIFCTSALRYGLIRAGAPGSGLFPLIAGIILIGLSLIVLISSANMKDDNEKELKEDFFPRQDSLKKILLALFGLFAYWISLEYFGFLLTTFMIMIFLLRLIETQRWITILAITILATASFHIVFRLWLKVQLPAGILGI